MGVWGEEAAVGGLPTFAAPVMNGGIAQETDFAKACETLGYGTHGHL